MERIRDCRCLTVEDATGKNKNLKIKSKQNGKPMKCWCDPFSWTWSGRVRVHGWLTEARKNGVTIVQPGWNTGRNHLLGQINWSEFCFWNERNTCGSMMWAYPDQIQHHETLTSQQQKGIQYPELHWKIWCQRQQWRSVLSAFNFKNYIRFRKECKRSSFPGCVPF